MRFREFTEPWRKSALSEVAVFYKGNGIAKENLSDFGNSCILYGELYTTYKTAIAKRIKSKTSLPPDTLFHSKKNDVIIPCSGETAEDIATSLCVPYDNILLGGDLTIIRSQLDGAFLSNQLNSVRKYDIARIAQGKSIVHLQADELKKIIIAFPSIEEQCKISNFIDLIDSRIEVQNKIIEDLKTLKKEICNRIFTSKATRRLGDFICECSERNTSNNCSNVLSVSNKYGFISQSIQFEDRTIASSDTKNYKIVKKGYFAYNPARINVGSIALLDSDIVGIISPMYLCFTVGDGLNAQYLRNFFYSEAFYRELHKKIEGSVRQCLTFDAMRNIRIYAPDQTLQHKIAALANTIEDRISREEKYLNLLLVQKKYLLSKMFI